MNATRPSRWTAFAMLTAYLAVLVGSPAWHDHAHHHQPHVGRDHSHHGHKHGHSHTHSHAHGHAEHAHDHGQAPSDEPSPAPSPQAPHDDGCVVCQFDAHPPLTVALVAVESAGQRVQCCSAPDVQSSSSAPISAAQPRAPPRSA